MEGKVKFFDVQKGYGFITEKTSQTDYFVHYTGTLDKIEKDDEVEFELSSNKRGPMATDVRRKKKTQKG